jgi:hypothetical protein
VSATGVWALWDNIKTVAMVTLLRKAYYVHVLKRSTVIITGYKMFETAVHEIVLHLLKK